MDEYQMSPGDEELTAVPFFGIGHLTVQRAAELATLDQWYSYGFSNIPDPDDGNGERTSPWLNEALVTECIVLRQRLSASIRAGTLVAAKVSRDLDDDVITDETWIEYGELYKWLEARGCHLGDMADDWVLEQNEILNQAAGTVRFLQASLADDTRWRSRQEVQAVLTESWGIDEADPVALAAAVKTLIVENAGLRRSLAESVTPSSEDLPVSSRERRTMLRIIRALDVLVGLPKRGAAPSVQCQLQQLGFTSGPGDTTIRKTLELARALEPDGNPQ